MLSKPSFTVVIPARYSSSRFPGKPLKKIAGKEMVLHVVDTAMRSDATEVLVATDDQRIFDVVEAAACKVCMTSPDHITGTDRLAEVVALNKWPADTLVVNLQGDEPLMPVSCINQVAENLGNQPSAVMATLATPITDTADYNDPNVVKVVFNRLGLAMLFSRSAIPHYRDQNPSDPVTAYRHLGIYAYRAGYLSSYPMLTECQIELAEKLEQLRVLHNGDNIHVDIASELPGPGVDTPEQLLMVEALMARGIGQNTKE